MEKNVININDFEGPLDLLLSLINKSKIDIYDIPIVEITNQYMDYIYSMDSLNIEVASEFIVMAATLLEIKSKALLPIVEEDEDEEYVDEKELLIKRLIEYKAYKEISGILKSKEDIYNKTIFKDPEYFDNIKDEVSVKEVDIELLTKAIKNILIKHQIRVEENSAPYELERQVFYVEDQILYIRNYLKEKDSISFFSLFTKVKDKGYIIATFLAVLELLKMEIVDLVQSSNYDDFNLVKV